MKKQPNFKLHIRNSSYCSIEGIDISSDFIFQLTRFTGSTCAILHDELNGILHFYVDGRYALQAKNQFQANKLQFNELIIKDYRELFAVKDQRISLNPYNTTLRQYLKLKDSNNITLDKAIPIPQLRSRYSRFSVVFDLLSAVEKAKDLYNLFPVKDQWIFIANCSFVSWVFNIRIKDTDKDSRSSMVPIFCLFNNAKSKVFLFSDSEIINFNEHKILPICKMQDVAKEEGIKEVMCNFDEVFADIVNIFAQVTHYDTQQHNKSHILNEIEVCSVVHANILDSYSKTTLLNTLYSTYASNPNPQHTEISIAEEFYNINSALQGFLSLSFDTIVACDANASYPHHQPTNESVRQGSLLLIDGGCQYTTGTTDSTRTIFLGDNPPYNIQFSYTVVLKAHINLAKHQFLPNTPACDLDAVSRDVVHKYDLKYDHSTGHGVGRCGNVHDGIVNISSRSKATLPANCVISIEPGCYIEGEYGIRIENLYITKLKDEMMFFEPLTLIPFDEKLILERMLSNQEREWLEYYNAAIRDKIKL